MSEAVKTRTEDLQDTFFGDQDLSVTRNSYHLTPEELAEREAALIDHIKQETGQTEGVVCVLVRTDSPYADICRTLESNKFGDEDYDFYVGMQPHEARSLFLYTTDLGLGKIAHSKRLVFANDEATQEATGLTGIEMLDDRLLSEVDSERMDLDQILEFHGIDSVTECLNVSTNMRLIEQKTLEEIIENPYTLISYKGVYQLVEALGVENIVAYLNQKAIASLIGRLGLEYQELGGQQFHLPNAGSTTEYDPDYLAVVIPKNEHNRQAFTVANPDYDATMLVAEREVSLLAIRDDSRVDRVV